MARHPDLQTIYLSFSSYGQKLFPVSSIAPLTFSPFPLPRHSLPMPHVCPFCHALSYRTHPQSALPIPPNYSKHFLRCSSCFPPPTLCPLTIYHLPLASPGRLPCLYKDRHVYPRCTEGFLFCTQPHHTAARLPLSSYSAIGFKTENYLGILASVRWR